METIPDVIGDFFSWTLFAVMVGLMFTGVRIFTRPRSAAGTICGWLAAAAFGIAGGLVVTCLVILLGQARALAGSAGDDPRLSAVICEDCKQ